MKRQLLLLTVILLLTLAAGCRPTEPEPVEPDPPPEAEPLRLETLAVELSRDSVDAQVLMTAVRELPALLADAFAETEVEIGEITVTAGASPADTVQALEEGGVHLAFLPAEGYLSSGSEAVPLFGDAREGADGAWRDGAQALICAAPTEYGAQLAERAGSGKPLSWSELENARWGILEEDLSGDYRYFELWLSNEHAGRQVADLPDVTAYGTYEALFRAAAREEIDALVFQDDVRAGVAEVWSREEVRTDAAIVHGFGREAEIWEELPVLEVTEALYSRLAVAANVPELTDGRFTEALAQVLEQLANEAPEQMEALGAALFTAVSDEVLETTRRQLALE